MDDKLSRRVKEHIAACDETIWQTERMIALCKAWLAAFHQNQSRSPIFPIDETPEDFYRTRPMAVSPPSESALSALLALRRGARTQPAECLLAARRAAVPDKL